METDRRIVPEKHIAYLLEEDTISERTIEVKKLLHDSPDKIHHVAHTWMGHNGLNPLARIIIHHIPEVPKKHRAPHIATQTHSTIHETHQEETSHGHVHHHHEHSSGVHHILGEHQHTSEHSQVGHHTHDIHNHGDHHDGVGEHAHHGHHHGGAFSGFVSTGHWFGDQGAYIFGMLGRIIGEIIGYLFKTLAVAIIFGPTRTVLLIALIGILLNSTANTDLPIGIAAGIAGIIHLIFTGINKLSSGGHGESHSADSHGGGEHGGGGHGHH